MIFLLTAGCTFGLANLPDEGVVSAATRIDSITPKRGPPSGGTAVTIEGAGFVGDVSVTFGGVAADAVTLNSSKSMVVTTPRVGVEATVDVQVVSDAGVDTLPVAFTFSRSAGGDDTGGGGDDSGRGGDDTGGLTDTDTPPSYVGMVAGYVTYDQSIIMCPDCFASDGAPAVTATAVFHEPEDGSWLDWLPAEGTCGDSTDLPLASTFLDAGTPLTMSSGSVTVELHGTSGGDGTTYAATTPTYAESTTFSLSAPGGTDLDAFSLASAMVSAPGFSDLQPFGLGATSTADAYSASFPATGTTMVWAPSGSGTFVTVQLDATSRSGSSLGSSICRFADTGSGTIPATVFTDWPAGSQLAVRIDRWVVTEVVLDWEPTLELSSRFEMVGTGVVE